MATKSSEFDKVLSAWDILVIAFGAMIGWGWVVSTGDWITRGGVVGAMLGFVIGGIMVFFVGLTYAELTSAMPQCGGEHVFSFKAMGPIGSFICTWAIVLGYVSVVCFEACAMPTIITYIYPDFLQGYLYSVAGFEIYASWLITAIVVSVFITWVNIRGVKTAAILQTVLTVIIGGVGIILIAAGAFNGSASNLEAQVFVGGTTSDWLKGTLAVAVMTPFYFIGFDVIPQAAEEITVGLKKIGRILILSVILAVLFYALIIGAVGMIMNGQDIALSMKGVGGLVTADAMAQAFNSTAMAKVLIIGGIAGIITSWNSFMIGGSRAMYSMAESYMIPHFFAKLHSTHKTPVNALYLIGLLSVIAPFFGRKMLVWVVDAGNFGCCVAYCMVAISFVILRKTHPEMPRPYKVNHYKIVGALAIIMSGIMVVLYMVPGSPAALVPQEWAMVGIWIGLGVIFGFMSKAKYGDQFATHIDVATENNTNAEAAEDLAFGRAMEKAMESVQSTAVAPAEYDVRPIDFTFAMSVPLVFGKEKSHVVGTMAKAYGEKGLIVADSTKGTGVETVMTSLISSGLKYEIYPHGTSAITDVVLQNGIVAAQKSKAAFLIAVGTSAAMNCAKAIAYQLGATLPIFYVPTTFDCADAVTSKFTAIDNAGAIKTIDDARIAPKAVIADPDCMKDMSERAIAESGFAALCQDISVYTAPDAQPFTDALVLYGMDLLKANLANAIDENGSQDAWEKVVLAGMISSMTAPLADNTLLKAAILSMPEEKRADTSHFLGAIMPSVVSTIYKTDVFKFGKVSRTLDGFTASDCGDRLTAISKALRLVQPADLGLSAPDLTHITTTCLAYLQQPGKSPIDSMGCAASTPDAVKA